VQDGPFDGLVVAGDVLEVHRGNHAWADSISATNAGL
jgi:hypothetical protein